MIVDSLRLFDVTRLVAHLTLDWCSTCRDTVNFGFDTILIGSHSDSRSDWSKLLAQSDRQLAHWSHCAQRADRKNHPAAETCQLEKGMKTAPATQKLERDTLQENTLYDVIVLVVFVVVVSLFKTGILAKSNPSILLLLDNFPR